MIKRTAESLIAEFRAEQDKIPHLRNLVQGKQDLLAEALTTSDQRHHSAVWWILLAHYGTLDKLDILLRREGPHESIELLAVARNIFENLVWLRLMKASQQFGIVFYAQLLCNQIESGQAFVQKAKDEATLFDEFDNLDADALDQHSDDIGRAIAVQNQQSDDLDDLMRREFCLYASQATQNGYGYQAHLVRTQVLPAYEAQLNELVYHKQTLDRELLSLVDARHAGFATGKWNWYERARDVKMDGQYRFLYSFTSKLLHAIPLNIITEKELSDDESIMVLDYIAISAADLLKLIEEFSGPS